MRSIPVPRVGDLLDPATGARDVLLYVHGFNQTFESAAIDAARVSDGIRFRGETMLFSWPSKAKLLDYGYDRESAMWSRDALEQVFAGLMASPGRRPHPRGRAQHRHHADDGGAAADLRAAGPRRDRSHRRGDLRLARHRHGRVLVLGRTDRPARHAHHRHHRDQRPRAGGVGMDRAAPSASARPRRRSSRSSGCA